MNKPLKIDRTWTLFLDRDGVINHKLPGDYVRNSSEFRFLPSVLESIALLNQYFERIIIITNQQGIGKGIMSALDLEKLHEFMLNEIEKSGGKIDAIYYCPHIAGSGSKHRKPETGMAYQAQQDFPEIDFNKTIMVGDSVTDMEFGKKLKLTTVFIAKDNIPEIDNKSLIDYVFTSLKEFSDFIYESNKF